MADEDILICAADAVLEGGRGVRFLVTAGGDDGTGFVVRYGGKAYAYLNRSPTCRSNWTGPKASSSSPAGCT